MPIKSLTVASSWSRLYLLIKDAQLFEHKENYRCGYKKIYIHSKFQPYVFLPSFHALTCTYILWDTKEKPWKIN